MNTKSLILRAIAGTTVTATVTATPMLGVEPDARVLKVTIPRC